MVRLGRVAATFSGTDALTVPDIEAEWGKPRTAFNPFWAQVAAELDRLEVCRGGQIVEVVDGTPETSEANDPPATTTTTTTTTTTLPALPELTVEVEYVDGTPETSQYQGGMGQPERTYSKTLTWEHDPPRDPAVSIWGAPWGCYIWDLDLVGRSNTLRTGAHEAKVLALDTGGAYVEQHRNSLTLPGLLPASYQLVVSYAPGNPSYGYRHFAHGVTNQFGQQVNPCHWDSTIIARFDFQLPAAS